MKRLLFILSIVLLFSCSSYDEFIEYNGGYSNYENVILSDLIDYYLTIMEENPLKLLDELVMFEPQYDTLITYSGDTIVTCNVDEEYQNKWDSRYNQSQELVGRMTIHSIKQKITDISDSSYRNWITWSMIEDGIFLAGTYMLLPKKLPTTPVIEDLVIYGCKNDPVIWTFTLPGYGKVKMTQGNSFYGLTHILEKHTPFYYIKWGKLPKSKTTLFLESDKKYIKSILDRFMNVAKESFSLDGRNTIYTGKLKTKFGERWYSLAIGSNGEIVSFYPTTKINKQIVINKSRNPAFSYTYKDYITISKLR